MCARLCGYFHRALQRSYFRVVQRESEGTQGTVMGWGLCGRHEAVCLGSRWAMKGEVAGVWDAYGMGVVQRWGGMEDLGKRVGCVVVWVVQANSFLNKRPCDTDVVGCGVPRGCSTSTVLRALVRTNLGVAASLGFELPRSTRFSRGEEIRRR